MSQQFWSDDEDKLLRSLWEQDFSASEIGMRLGHRTKGSVVGRAFRLGLATRKTGRRKSMQERESLRRIVAARVGPSVRADHGQEPAAEASLQQTPGPPFAVTRARAVAPRERRISFAKLEHDSCRWPHGHVGAPDFSFCGAKRMGQGGSPYCARHHKMAHQGRTARAR